MTDLKEYIIKWEGLKQGLHEFNFELGEEFFLNFQDSPINNCKVVTDLSMEKQSTMLILNFHVYGQVSANCDRCLGALNIPINFEEKIYVKFGDEHGEQTENVIVVPHNENEINIAQHLYEFAVLALPRKVVHENLANCDQDVIKKLNDSERGSGEKGTDPRWDKLNELQGTV